MFWMLQVYLAAGSGWVLLGWGFRSRYRVQYRGASCGNVQKCLWQGFWIEIKLAGLAVVFRGCGGFGQKWDNAGETSLWGERLKRIFSLDRKCISFWSKRAFSLSVWKSFSACVGSPGIVSVAFVKDYPIFALGSEETQRNSWWTRVGIRSGSRAIWIQRRFIPIIGFSHFQNDIQRNYKFRL